MMECAEARKQFPAGLVQPEGAFRFSADALLLARFAVEQAASGRVPEGLWYDLGTGCGVVGLGILLGGGASSVCGLEMDRALVEAGNSNAARLGVAFEAEQVEFGAIGWKQALGAFRKRFGAAGCVVANPPWRKSGTGREPLSERRKRALFRDEETFGLFVEAAAALLRADGLFASVVGADCLTDWLMTLRQARFCPVRLRFVHARPDRNAEFVLVAARRTGQSALVVEPPLLKIAETAL